jgi:hypothetical protein
MKRLGISTCCIMVLRGLNAWQSDASEKRKWNRTSKSGNSMKPTFSKRHWFFYNGTKRRLPICEAGKKCCALSIHYSETKMTSNTKLSLFKTAITQDVWLFPLQLHYELSYTSWAWLGFTMVTSYMTTAGTHYSTTKKRTAINHCLEIERLLQQIRISAAVPASMRGL